MKDMIRDIGEDSFHQAHVYDSLKDDSLTKLYPVVQVFHVCQQYYDYLISREELGVSIKTSLNCFNCCMKYFQKVIHCRPITMRPRRYCVQ